MKKRITAMQEDQKELFSKRVTAGSRTYFIDVKGSKEGVLYLVITESRPSDEGYEHERVMVFEENLAAFAEALEAAFEFLGLPARAAPKPTPPP
jgi:hypothetical protein